MPKHSTQRHQKASSMLHQTKFIKQDKTQTTTWRTAQRAAKLALLGLSAAVLVACGGGGGANPTPGNTPLGTVLSAEVQSGVVVPTQAAAQAANIKTSSDESGIILSNLTGDLANLQNGQVVHLPANDAQGIPLGFAGKVETQPDGTVKLLPAAMGDVFKTLSLDFDSVRDGGLIAGLVVPKNGSMQANIQAPSSMQTGLEYASCQLGLAAVVDIKCKNGEMEGTVTLQHPLLVNKKGSKEKAQANLYAQIDLRKMGVKVAVDFDEIKYASTGGFNILEAKVQGEWGVSMGIKLEDEAAKAEIPAWSELIRSDGANIWDENTKIKFSKYFELSGLNGDDKKGLIPLGGIYLTPANFSVGGKGFGGELTAGQLAKIKAAGVILWVYMDMSGNITLSGDLKFVEVTGGGFQRGFKIQRVDGVLKSTIFNTKTTPNVFAPRIKGKVESTQTIGLALAADVLVSGIRPATVKTTLLGFKTTTTVEGDGGYRWSPQPTGMNGTLCASGNNQIFTDFLFRAGINAKLDVGWINLEGKAEYAYAPEPYVWWEDGFGACVNNFALKLVHAQTLPDTYESGKSVLTLNFSEAYNNAALRAQVERWQVVETVAGVTSQFYADSSDAGVLQLPRGPGVYSYTVKALHKDINGTTGQPVVVAQSSPVVVNVSAMPSVAFSANIIQSNCKRLRVESSSVAGAGTSFTNYAWIVKPINANAITATGSSATIDLPVCGVVDVTLTVTDNLERQATVTRGVNTNEIAPSITGVTPISGTVGLSKNFTVSGKNLPPTVVFSMADASCSSLTSVSMTGFMVNCTAHSAGIKPITIKTNTDTNGGVVIDDTRSVEVMLVSDLVSKLPHTGISVDQCYSAGSNNLELCTGAGPMALNAQQDGYRAAINPMSYSQVPHVSLAGHYYTKNDCVKDNVTGLVWEGKTANNDFRDYRKTFTNFGDARAGDASAYVAAVNAAWLCGKNDWRLPTVDELQTIADYGKPYPGPTVNLDWFVNTGSGAYWSSSPFVGNSNVAWGVYFGRGGVYGDFRVNGYPVRLVRASQ